VNPSSDPHIPRVGVGVVIRRGAEVLLMRRHGVHGAGTWSTPGGYLEYGESPAECAAREAHEETGVSVSDVRFLAITNDFFPEREKHFITVWMHAAHAGGDAALHAPEESMEVAWFPHDRLPEPLFQCFDNLLHGQAEYDGHWFLR
jgi:8-oxo-dGTP diphosphatase